MSDDLAAVDVLLCRWGRRALRCESAALGFASCSILSSSAASDGFDTAIPKGVADADIEAVDGAVKRLPKLLQVVVIEVYQFGQGKSARAQAEKLGVDRLTLGKYLVSAHRKIVLDIGNQYRQNLPHSANGGSCLQQFIQPATI